MFITIKEKDGRWVLFTEVEEYHVFPDEMPTLLTTPATNATNATPAPTLTPANAAKVPYPLQPHPLHKRSMGIRGIPRSCSFLGKDYPSLSAACRDTKEDIYWIRIFCDENSNGWSWA